MRTNKTLEVEKAINELVVIQKKVLLGEPVPNYEYNEVLKKVRSARRGNWRVFEVHMLVEAQSDWSIKEVKDHIKLVLDDSLLRRYTVKVGIGK